MEIREKVELKIDVLKGKFAELEKDINILNEDINKMNNEIQQKNNLLINKRVDITAVDRSIKHLEELL